MQFSSLWAFWGSQCTRYIRGPGCTRRYCGSLDHIKGTGDTRHVGVLGVPSVLWILGKLGVMEGFQRTWCTGGAGDTGGAAGTWMRHHFYTMPT